MFENESFEVIVERMLQSMSNEIDKREGAVAWDMTAPTAIELAQFYISLDNALKYAFINEDMPTDLLTIAAADFGVDRKWAVPTQDEVTLTGPQDLIVPVGTQVRSEIGVYFATLKEVTLYGGTATVEVEALVAGVQGNVNIGTVNNVVGEYAGILRVTNEHAFDSGVDDESNASLVQRVYNKMRKPATSGNIYHYEQWALTVPGVYKVHIFPLWDGPGTVKVIVLGDDNRAPSQSVLDNAAAYIDTQRPIGADVTVISAQELPINVDVSLALPLGVTPEDVRGEVEDAIDRYLQTLTFKDTLVRYTRILVSILDAHEDIIDYGTLTVNNSTYNVTMTEEQIAILGTVTIHAV